ncbi:MAG: DUF429 domain-containing protein [Alphaproteobacteria bacterium]|nr:DUF429 domain-containing protein [Alphaproteobacteria bacterium]
MTNVAVGWDVGGWHGTGNAVAVLVLTDAGPKWLGAASGRLPSNLLDLRGFVRHFCGDEAAVAVAAPGTVVGVDAPLGLPTTFRAFVADAGTSISDARLCGAFLDNPLAFRKTDREIARRFPSKPPLSATFDKLGNPASVAVRHVHAWTGGRGPTVGRDVPTEGVPSIIEVYPAFCKQLPRRAAPACVPYGSLLSDFVVGTDIYDAALAAILALGWRNGDDEVVPRLSVTDNEPGEGAIWYPSDPAWRLPVTPPRRAS